MLNAQQDVRAAGQEEVVAFLSRSETFGGQAVEIVETHASIIFLAGDRAFKLKRGPIQFFGLLHARAAQGRVPGGTFYQSSFCAGPRSRGAAGGPPP